MTQPTYADIAEILADLARVRAVFQLRTVAAVLGAPTDTKGEG